MQCLIGIALAHDTIAFSREMHLVYLRRTAVGWNNVSSRNIDRQPVDDRIVQGTGAAILRTHYFTCKQWNGICT